MEYNQLLEQRFNRAAKAVLGLEEQDGINAVAPEIAPCVVLEADRPEWEKLRSVELASWGWNVIAAPALTSAVFMLNPPGSRALVVIEGIIASNGGWFWRMASAAAIPGTASLDAARTRDNRFLNDPTIQNAESVCIFGLDNTQVVAEGSSFRMSPNVWYKAPIILGPGRMLTIGMVNVNTGLFGGLNFRERPMRNSEMAR